MEKRKLVSSKIEGYSGKATDEAQRAIIKVSKANYVPAGIAIQSKISSYIFTSVLPKGTVSSLEKDPLVVSVSLNRGMNTID